MARLDRAIFMPRIITLSEEPIDSRAEEFRKLHIPIYCLGISRLQSLLVGFSKLRKFLKENPVDIIQSQGVRSDLLNALLRHPRPRIATQRNDPFADYPMLYGRLIGYMMAHAHISILRQLPKVVTCSYSIEAAIRSHRVTCSTIQNGVDNTTVHAVSPSEKKEIRASLKLPTAGILFLWAAPFIARKNPLTLIKAFNSLQNHEKRHLCLLGDGPILEPATDLACQRPNISFKGNVDNVGEYMKAADCFVSTSLSEGLPNSVIEALSWGLPTILSDIPAHREIHKTDQRVGSLFPLNNLQVLIDLLTNFRHDNSIATISRALVLDHFNADTTAHQYQSLYQEVLTVF